VLVVLAALHLHIADVALHVVALHGQLGDEVERVLDGVDDAVVVAVFALVFGAGFDWA
jgi:hypothetical protein